MAPIHNAQGLLHLSVSTLKPNMMGWTACFWEVTGERVNDLSILHPNDISEDCIDSRHCHLTHEAGFQRCGHLIKAYKYIVTT